MKGRLHLESRLLHWASLLVAILLIIFLRAPEVLMSPALQVEDGSHIFAHFYQNRGGRQLFRFKAGYCPLIANFIGYLSVRLPTALIPFGLTWGPLIITLVTYSWFFQIRYRSIIVSDRLRALTCILFALAPISSFHHLSNTDYSIWNTLLLLVLLSAVPLPKDRRFALPLCALTNLLVWSHPLTIVALPLQVRLLMRDRHNATLYVLTIVNILTHQFLGIDGLGAYGGGTAALFPGLVTAMAGTALLTAAAAFRSAFGPVLHAWAHQHAWALIIVWIVLVTGFTIYIFRASRTSRLPILGIVYVIVSITFLSVLGRGDSVTSDIRASRYIYVQMLMFLLLYVLILSQFSHLKQGNVDSNGNRASSPLPSRLCLPILAYYFVLNVVNGDYIHLNIDQKSGYRYAGYHYAHPENGRIVKEFFADLADAEELHPDRRDFYLIAQKINDWPIIIDTRQLRIPGQRDR